MSTQQATRRVFNFSAGPAVLPVPVLEQVQQDLLCLPGAGASILEVSHRSEAFATIMADAERRLRELLSIPAGYRVLFLQGGSRLQFSMVPVNLAGGETPPDYLVTGSWSQKAVGEAERVGPVRTVWDGKPDNFDRLPAFDSLDLNSEAPYAYLTSNETIQGVQFPADLHSAAPLVIDSSSDFLCRPVPIEQYGLLYACAQKNAGPAGVTVVVIRDDLLDRAPADTPGYLQYREHAANNSLYNTPPTFAIYVLGLVCQWLQDEIGGLAAMERRNREKSQQLYQRVDGSDGFYVGHAKPDCRSLMNVTFRMRDAELESAFFQEAEAEGLASLQGHRSVGGARASIYNAMPVAGVEALAQFMGDFAHRNG